MSNGAAFKDLVEQAMRQERTLMKNKFLALLTNETGKVLRDAISSVRN